MPVDVEQVTREDVEAAIAARFSFRSYVKFVHNWTPRVHQEIWFSAFQALTDGKLMSGEWLNGVAQTPVEERQPTNKLMIIGWPGSGKSDTAVEYLAWMIGRSVAEGGIPQGGIVSYADDIARGRSVAIRDTIESSDEYALVFPGCIPQKSKGWANSEWVLWREDQTKKDPTLRAAGINGGILSYRFPTILLIDDPHDRRTVATQGPKDEVHRIWKSTIRTRVAIGRTPIVEILTRWADDDLAGRQMEEEAGQWCIVRSTALIPPEEDAPDRHTHWEPEITAQGDPVGISTEALLEMEGDEDFETQFMASPPSAKGDLFKWWHFGTRPSVQDIERVYQMWDTAFNETKRSTYSVMCEFWYLKNGRSFLNNVVEVKVEFPGLLKLALELYHDTCQLFGEKAVIAIIEGKASGQSMAQMLRIAGNFMAKDIPKGDLTDRGKISSAFFETGHIFLPEYWEPWKERYMRQLKGFPRTQYKDQVAATVLYTEHVYPSEARGRPQPWGRVIWAGR